LPRSTAESTGCSTPASAIWVSRAISTVNTRSASDRAPSATSRSAMPLSTKATFTAIPVSAVKASTSGWISSGWRCE